MSNPFASPYPFVGPLSGALGWLASWTGDTSFDTVGDTVSLASTNRGNKVAQEFQKKLSAIDYQIQRQELHRQDIRDLVEVTTGRMDVFLLSGTLLLTFCLGWFSQSRIMESELPVWFENLFLISNFNAVGYLLLCVWLAMHASIASHSLGVRLLVNYQRLSIPTDKQLRQIYVPFFPQNKMSKLVAIGQRLGFIPEDEEAELPDEVHHYDNECHSWPLQMGADDMHFRRFLQAQSKWLAYDAYARVCLTLGMNQMLHALSYYVVGELGKSGCVAGTVFTFFGVKGLSLAVMKLDVSDGSATSSEKHYAAALAVACTILPSLIAAVLLFLPVPWLSEAYKSMWALPCFLLHYMFNRFMRFNIRPVEPEGGGLKLPRMFRAVGYLSIIEFTQRKIADAMKNNQALRNVNNLETLRTELEQRMADVVTKESQQTQSTQTQRRGQELENIQKRMNDLVQELSNQTEYCTSAETELDIAMQSLDRFKLWQQAPEILAMLHAFRAQEDANDQAKHEIEKWYGSFLDQCRDLDLGITIPEDCRSFAGSSRSMSFSSMSASGLNLRNGPTAQRSNRQVNTAPQLSQERSVDEHEVKEALNEFYDGIKRVTSEPKLDAFEVEAGFGSTAQATSNGTKKPLWREKLAHTIEHIAEDLPPLLHPKGSAQSSNSGKASKREGQKTNRGTFRQVSSASALDANPTGLPLRQPSTTSGGEQAVKVNTVFRGGTSRVVFDEDVIDNEGRHHHHHHHASHQEVDTNTPSRLHSSQKFEFQIPKEATPPDELPTELVLGFNKAIGIWWIMAAIVHCYRSYVQIQTLHQPTHRGRLTSQMRLLQSTWPEPASLFQVASLHCDNSQVILNNRFSTFSSERHPNGTLGPPKKFANVQIPAIHCDHQGCDALTQASSNTSWLLAPLPHPRGSARAKVELPGNHTWHKVSVLRTPCSDGSCDDAIRIAGWDGFKVIVADFQKKNTDKWGILRSFFVRPGLGKCRAPPRDCPNKTTQYTNVRALQLGSGGRSLLVLLEDGFLDGWDLSTGVLRGRWHHNSHTAMCHDENELFLARQSSEGPIIEVAPLPSLLEDEHQPEEVEESVLNLKTIG